MVTLECRRRNSSSSSSSKREMVFRSEASTGQGIEALSLSPLLLVVAQQQHQPNGRDSKRRRIVGRYRTSSSGGDVVNMAAPSSSSAIPTLHHRLLRHHRRGGDRGHFRGISGHLRALVGHRAECGCLGITSMRSSNKHSMGHSHSLWVANVSFAYSNSTVGHVPLTELTAAFKHILQP